MIEHWLITGDTHRNFNRFKYLDKTPNTGIIILGDVGLNYTFDKNDRDTKRSLCEQYPYDFYCVRGNHEARPKDVKGMHRIYDKNVNGTVWIENEFPHIRYFCDWGIYEINGLRTLVVGGAYSVDKHYRLSHGMIWHENEQLSAGEMESCFRNLTREMMSFDLVLTHTCPLSFQPTDLFLGFIDQSSVDNSMEVWMEKLMKSINWKYWLFGHYHADRVELPHVEQFYREIEPLETIIERWAKYDETGELEWWLPLAPRMKRIMEEQNEKL